MFLTSNFIEMNRNLNVRCWNISWSLTLFVGEKIMYKQIGKVRYKRVFNWFHDTNDDVYVIVCFNSNWHRCNGKRYVKYVGWILIAADKMWRISAIWLTESKNNHKYTRRTAISYCSFWTGYNCWVMSKVWQWT